MSCRISSPPSLSSSRWLVLLALGLAGCGSEVPEAELHWGSLQAGISGGESAAPGEFAGTVFLDIACTGVLVSTDTVVYAAHCGSNATRAWWGEGLRVRADAVTQTIAVEAPDDQTAAIEFCRAHPRAAIGGPFDVAFCRFAQPIIEREQLPAPLAGCERAALRAGVDVTLVGYGLEPVTGTVGIKRVVHAPLEEAGAVLVAGDTRRGSCGGDSGGPLFVRTDDLDASWPAQWRLAGVLSSGNASEICGMGRYVEVAGILEWLETESARDVTPCGDAAGNWAATPRCRFPVLGEATAGASRAADTCGQSYEAAGSDTAPPEFSDVHLENRLLSDGVTHLDVVAAAVDAGFGIERVSVEVLAAGQALLSSQYSEVPPFSFRGLSLPAVARSIRVTARDHAGLSTTVELPTREAEPGGCAASAVSASGQRPYALGVHVGSLLALFGLRRLRAQRVSSHQVRNGVPWPRSSST
jgi:hypothetical protein